MRRWPLVARAICVALLSCGIAAEAAAEVIARVEPEVIDELETAQLTLRAAGAAIEPLDLAPLAADFEVLGTQTSSQYRSSNGVVESWIEYQVTLRPNRAGELTVPALTIGGATSAPLTLVVRRIDPALRAAIERMVFFEVELTANPVFIRAETVLIRRLYYSNATQIYSDLPGPPELTDALVIPIGETRSHTALRDGERYGVIEQRFALYPERSGTLVVPSISLTTSVRLQSDGRTRRMGAQVITQPLAIEVLPIPPEYPKDAPWLPAAAVELQDAWSPDRASLKVGEPIRRRVTVTVGGNVAAAITPPADDLPERHFRQYPEPAVLHDDRSGSSVTGSRTTDYALIPTARGKVGLPGIAVTWWDVNGNAVRTSRVEDRTVSIEGAVAYAPAVAEEAQGAPAATPHAHPKGPPDAAPATPSAAQSTAFAMTWPGGLALGLVLLASLALLVRALRAPRQQAGERPSPGAVRLTSTQSVPRGAGGMLARARALRRLRRALAAACGRGDPAAVDRALQGYLACWYRARPATAAAHFRAAGFGPLLDRLQAARFAPAGRAPPGAEVLAAVRALAPTPRGFADPLPELYPGR